MTIVPFASRLEARANTRSMLCVGIDPDEKTLERWGLPVSADGAREFALRLLDATAERVAIFKPQVAFFERFGLAGFKVLDEVMKTIRSADALVLADVKRLDIDSTFAAYAKAWMGEDAGFPADAITIGAYMGADSLEVVLNRALETGCGVFPVVRSSNPGGIALQNARMEDDLTIAEHIAEALTAFNRRTSGTEVGLAGAVVGATLEDARPVLERLPYSLILAPGIGAQGATVGDVALRFGPSAARRTLASVSRAVAHAGPSSNQLTDAVERLKDDVFKLQDLRD